jgi:hypothetical protein
MHAGEEQTRVMMILWRVADSRASATRARQVENSPAWYSSAWSGCSRAYVDGRSGSCSKDMLVTVHLTLQVLARACQALPS